MVLNKLKHKGGNLPVYNLPNDAVAALFQEAEVVAYQGGPFDFLLAFVRSAEEVAAFAQCIENHLSGDPVLWMIYPKTTSKLSHKTLSRDRGWESFGPLDLEGVAAVSINADWTALRFRSIHHIKSFQRKGGSLSEAGKRKVEENVGRGGD